MNSAVPVFDELPPEDAAGITALCEQGILTWILEPQQVKFYELIWEQITAKYKKPAKRDDERTAAIMACRKIGKSFVLMLIAIEFANKYPGSNIFFVTSTADAANEIVAPIIAEISPALPPKCRPKFVNKAYVFENGSRLKLKGCDLNPDGLRGPSKDLILVDEAAFTNKLRYAVESILRPMTIRTRGITVMASSRGRAATDEFNIMWKELEAIGQAVKLTIYEAGFPPEVIEAERRSIKNPAVWRIEYECEDETDSSILIIPEWQLNESTILARGFAEPLELARQWAPPKIYMHDGSEHIQKYVWRITAVDFGVSDNTVVISGIYDFANQRLVPMREWIAQGKEVTAKAIYENGARMEAEVDAELGFAGVSAAELPLGIPPWTRVGDHDMPMLNTLSGDFGWHISPVQKPSLEEAVNFIRSFLPGMDSSTGELMGEPGIYLSAEATPNLFACIRTGIWTERAGPKGNRIRVFARTSLEDANGMQLRHFDALAGFIYMGAAARTLCQYEPTPLRLAQKGTSMNARIMKTRASADTKPDNIFERLRNGGNKTPPRMR
jgi:hypothetical protein